MNPIPEPRAYIDAQIQSLLDPSSSRDTVLITPGSPMPSMVPDGLHVGNTRRGLVITKNPEKIAMIDKGNEHQVGMALFGFAHKQSPADRLSVISSNQEGVPVAELAVPNHQKTIEQAMQAAGLLAPDGGNVELKTKQASINGRLAGLLN